MVVGLSSFNEVNDSDVPGESAGEGEAITNNQTSVRGKLVNVSIVSFEREPFQR